MAYRNDTIAAIATAPGRGGVAIVRVSGPEAFAVAEKVAGTVPGPGRFEFARFRNPAPSGNSGNSGNSGLSGNSGDSGLSGNSGNSGLSGNSGDSGRPGSPALVDEGIVLAFKSPRSYTGEDVVEFQCHGGAVAPRRVLDAAIAAGARLARRGEFTERAFLNGKIALDQAEAVLALVDAKTDRAAENALADLTGRSSAGTAAKSALKKAYGALLDVSSGLEHSLDVDEGDLPEDFFASLANDVRNVDSLLGSLIRSVREKRLLRDGVTVALAGPPNAGKSSLLNALAGAERAIVSAEPGTTRDAIDVWLDIEGWPVKLVDTAGLRSEGDGGGIDEIEAEGVRRAAAIARSADLVVVLTPPENQGLSPQKWGVSPGGKEGLSPQNWGVSPGGRWGVSPDEVADNCEKIIEVSSKCDISRGRGLNVSSKTGEGLKELKRAIASALERLADADERPPGAGEEELSSLANARTCVGESLRILESGSPDAVLAGNALRRAAEAIGAVLGAEPAADLLDRIFSRFCVGK